MDWISSFFLNQKTTMICFGAQKQRVSAHIRNQQAWTYDKRKEEKEKSRILPEFLKITLNQ